VIIANIMAEHNVASLSNEKITKRECYRSSDKYFGEKDWVLITADGSSASTTADTLCQNKFNK